MVAIKEKEHNQIHVLVVEDDYDDFYLVRDLITRDEKRNYQVANCDSLQACHEYLEREAPHIILLDLGLRDSSGLDTLQLLLSSNISVPVIVLTGTHDEALGELAIKAGAEDYLPKGEVSATLLSRAISYAIERHTLISILKQKAHEDALTGLPNRLALFDRMEFLIGNAERGPVSLAVAIIDLDGFKDINDTLGHHAGDELLRHVARNIKEAMRISDIAARYGGDEFVLVLTNYNSRRELLETLERKLSAIRQPLTIHHTNSHSQVKVGASIGVVEWSTGQTAQQMINRADEAMYQSKKQGKNQITLAD